MKFNNLKYYLAMIIVQALLALNIVFSKYTLDRVSPALLFIIKFTLAGLPFLVFLIIVKKKSRKITLWNFKMGLISSILGLTLSQLLFTYGLSYTTSNNTGIICATIPFLSLVFSSIRYRQKPSIFKTTGFLVSLVAVLFILDFSNFSISNKTFIGDLLIFLACISLSLFVTYCKDFFEKNDPVWASCLMFAFSSVQMLPFFLINFNNIIKINWDEKFVLSMLFLIICGTIATFFLSNWSLGNIKPELVSLFSYLQPVFTFYFAFNILQEKITSKTIISSVLVLAGLLIVVIDEKALKKKTLETLVA